MKFIKRLLPIILCLVFTFSLVACDKGGSGDGGVKGEIIDTGKISAICPEGWSNSPVTDLFSDNDEIDDTRLQFYRTDDIEDLTKLFSADSVNIYYYDEDTIYMDSKDFYDNVEDTSIQVNGETWEGYTGESLGVPIATFNNADTTIVVTFAFTSGEIDVTSDVVTAILESITID